MCDMPSLDLSLHGRFIRSAARWLLHLDSTPFLTLSVPKGELPICLAEPAPLIVFTVSVMAFPSFWSQILFLTPALIYQPILLALPPKYIKNPQSSPPLLLPSCSKISTSWIVQEQLGLLQEMPDVSLPLPPPNS